MGLGIVPIPTEENDYLPNVLYRPPLYMSIVLSTSSGERRTIETVYVNMRWTRVGFGYPSDACLQSALCLLHCLVNATVHNVENTVNQLDGLVFATRIYTGQVSTVPVAQWFARGCAQVESFEKTSAKSVNVSIMGHDVFGLHIQAVSEKASCPRGNRYRGLRTAICTPSEDSLAMSLVASAQTDSLLPAGFTLLPPHDESADMSTSANADIEKYDNLLLVDHSCKNEDSVDQAECVCCMSAVSLYLSLDCQHLVYCKECFLRVAGEASSWVPTKRNMKTLYLICPMCRRHSRFTHRARFRGRVYFP